MIALDGLSINSVGELLFELTETSRVRRLYPDEYLRALEDLVFSVLFAERIFVPTKVPLVANVGVGEQVVTEIASACERLGKESLGPLPVLEQPHLRRQLVRHLQAFSTSFASEPSGWKLWALRESHAYLKPNPSHRGSDPARFEFPEKKEGYLDDRRLLDMVPVACINALESALDAGPYSPAQDCPSEVKAEFFRRIVITHLAISVAYFQRFGSSAKASSFYLPYSTRISLTSEQSLSRAYAEAESVVAPELVSRLKPFFGNRNMVLPILLELRDDRKVRTMRSVLHEALSERWRGRTKNNTKLLTEFEHLARKLPADFESGRTKMKFKVKGSMKIPGVPIAVEFEVERDIGAHTESSGLAIREPSSHSVETRIERWGALFPELAEPARRPNELVGREARASRD